MERTKVRKWKLTGGGFFYATINGVKRIIKPGQIFDAHLEDIPEGFRDVIIPVSEDAESLVTKKPEPEAQVKEVKAAPVETLKPKYEVKGRGAGYYNVVDINGKVMNEKALRIEAAEELLASLQ